MKRHILTAIVLVLALAGVAHAQTTQPRITSADVTYLGTVTLPSGVGNPNALAVLGSTMYVGCYFGAGNTGIATVTIPALGGTGTVITGCTTLPNLTQVHMGGTYTDVIASGIMPYNGRVIVGGTTYYDGSGGQVRSMWAGTATTHAGPYEVVVTDVGQYTDTVTRWRQSFVGGFQGMIPTEWRTLFGGPALAGGCCFPIIFRTSLGPSASVYNPDDVGVVNPIQSKMIVGYPYEHSTLGTWDASPPGTYYGATDQMGSVGFPSGTRSVLFTSRHGQTKCYGPGTSNKALVGTTDLNVSAYPYCYDPYDAPQGNHGPDYEPTMTAYDANDLLRVKTGELKAWEVQPYAKWVLPIPAGLTAPYYLRAGWFDEATNRYYVGDTSTNIIHVFNIAVGTNPTPVNCVETAGAWGPGPDALGWTNWAFYSATQETRTRNRTWTQTIAAANGGTACTYSATTVGSTGVQTEIEYRSTDTTIGMVASGTTVTCLLTAEAFEVPPGTGWVVQFARRLVDTVAGVANWTEHGGADTTLPYTASATVPLGNYEVRAIWSKIGAIDVPAVTTYPMWACVP